MVAKVPFHVFSPALKRTVLSAFMTSCAVFCHCDEFLYPFSCRRLMVNLCTGQCPGGGTDETNNQTKPQCFETVKPFPHGWLQLLSLDSISSEEEHFLPPDLPRVYVSLRQFPLPQAGSRSAAAKVQVQRLGTFGGTAHRPRVLSAWLQAEVSQWFSN